MAWPPIARVSVALISAGHRVTVIVESPVNGAIDHQGVTVCRVRTGGLPLFLIQRCFFGQLDKTLACVWRSLALNQRCRTLHQQDPFDIVQYTSYTATALFASPDLPAVVRLSSYEPLRQAAYGEPPSLDNRLLAWLEKIALRRANALFSPSELLAKLVASKTGRPVSVIEPPFFFPSQCGTTEETNHPLPDSLRAKTYLLFFGTLGRLKGVDTIAAILRPLLDDHPDLCFAFAGDDAGYRGGSMIDHLRQEAGPHTRRIIYLGRLNQQQLLPVIRHAELIVLPSRIDNLPNTCIEALACGKVVIGTRGTSFEQLIKDRQSGLLCEPASPAALLATINRALALTPAERAAIGRRARQRISALHPERSIPKLVSFYQRVIAEHRSGRE